MFAKTKKNKSENETTNTPATKPSTLQSWLTGRFGSFLIFSGVGYALYKFKIINKLIGYFKKDKGKQRDTHTNAEQTASASGSKDPDSTI